MQIVPTGSWGDPSIYKWWFFGSQTVVTESVLGFRGLDVRVTWIVVGSGFLVLVLGQFSSCLGIRALAVLFHPQTLRTHLFKVFGSHAFKGLGVLGSYRYRL